ncbi:tumor necrosis factor ligand superfamily member 11 [Eucyclogobius newberryi]|uniref:tumor necrosis factor ligand superfamily member 11 n=1 Tax=Eucyclogobius newberryi TaxID=166745 RepID=UPI003B5B8569
MAASHDYRGYLRDSVDLEATQHHRFHPVQSSETTYRPLLIGTLAIMGLLQVASSVAILLHLTGYLQEVDLSTAPQRPIEEMHTEPIMDALQGTPKTKRCKNRCKIPKDSVPSAHLPIRAKHEYPKGKPDTVTIEWDNNQGDLHCMTYNKGKLFIEEPGYYYVYAKTCFRYYYDADEVSNVDFSNLQLIQYIYHDIRTQNTRVRLMKTGSTGQWNNRSYNMYCAQQGRGVRLDQGDALSVNVSNAWLLDLDTEGTYFGVIKLAN